MTPQITKEEIFKFINKCFPIDYDKPIRERTITFEIFDGEEKDNFLMNAFKEEFKPQTSGLLTANLTDEDLKYEPYYTSVTIAGQYTIELKKSDGSN
jgi:hypothetical protein